VIATRLIGLLLLIFGAAEILGQVVPFIAFMRWIGWRWRAILENLEGSSHFGMSANVVVMALASLGLGWYLLFRGRRVHAWLMAGLGDECGRCGYNLRGITGGTCPECGERVGRG